MKRLYEGVSATSIVFFLIIVVGGFLFGTKTHKDKSRHNRKLEEKVSKAERQREEFHKKNNKSKDEELEYLRKMNDPLWNYYDEETHRYEPLPGRYNVDIPRRPREGDVH